MGKRSELEWGLRTVSCVCLEWQAVGAKTPTDAIPVRTFLMPIRGAAFLCQVLHQEGEPDNLLKIQRQKQLRTVSGASWLQAGSRECKVMGESSGRREQQCGCRDRREQIQCPFLAHFLAVETEAQRGRGKKEPQAYCLLSTRPYPYAVSAAAAPQVTVDTCRAWALGNLHTIR